MDKDVIIIGGGAAGLMCAIEAGRRGRRVLVIERNGRVGRKIEISGGGRCNFTNLNTTHKNFISGNPHFHKSALTRYVPGDFIELVESHRIRYHEKKLGQLFCDGSSRQIITMLLDECAAAGVEIRLNCQVESVKLADGFLLATNQGQFLCESLVVATGGLSIPKIGATDFGYRLARQFGLKVVAPGPALVPLTLSPFDLESFRPLSGISTPAVVSYGGAEFAESILITHRGLSGPAILQISSYWESGGTLTIDLLPEINVLELLSERDGGESELPALLARFGPKRFAQTWCRLYAPPKPLKNYSAAEIERVARGLREWRVRPAGMEGFSKAEVTKGGVDTDELSSKTMEARRVPGLYFVGEVTDVTGQLGGYNFQWAWASGHAAGQYV